MSAETPRQPDLEEALAEAGAFRQQYRVASQEEPPAALDDAIRAAARREVRARPTTIGSGFGGSWRVPASIAAAVVVSVTIAVMVSQHDTRLPAIGEEPRLETAGELGARKDQVAPGYRTVKEQPKLEAAKTPPYAPSPAAMSPASSPPAPVPAEAHNAQSELTAKIEDHVAGIATERDKPVRTQAPAKTEVPAAAEASASPTAANATAAPSPAPQVAPKATPDSAVLGQPLSKRRAVSNFAAAESKDAPWEKDPQTWLAHIEELRVAERMQDAEASFRAFRSRYPDFQVPAGFVVPVAPAPN